MSSQVERGTVREMVHTIAFRAGVLECILKKPVLGSLEIRSEELAHVQLLQRQIDDLRRYLNLPSAEPERKWIPVTEALPEEETTVLVSAHYDGDKCYDYKPNDYVTTAEYMDGRWFLSDEEHIMQLHKHHVIAWMPLPEPWREE